jgi:hypothetical protein
VLGQINFRAFRDSSAYISSARLEVVARQDFYLSSGTGSELLVLLNPLNGNNFNAAAMRVRSENTRFNMDVELGLTGSYYYGDPDTDGSWRSKIDNNRVEFQKRVSGVWTVFGYSNTGGGGTGSAHVIQDDGTPLTQRANLNFVGTGFTVYDDAGNDATVVSGVSVSSAVGYAANDLTWQVDGALYTGTGIVSPHVWTRPGRLTSVMAYVATPGITGSTVVDLLKNGVSIFGGTKPTVQWNATAYNEVVPTTTDFIKGDVLSLSILGYATGASDLTVIAVAETTGSSASLTGTLSHLLLSDLNTTSYSHLTSTQLVDLTNSGTTSLHKHNTNHREKLNASRTYYVRPDGNDSNTGLVNTPGGAFLTIQNALDTVSGLDINGQTTVVQLSSGTHTTGANIPNVVGYALPGNLTIQGDSSNPSWVNVVASFGFAAQNISTVWRIKDLRIQTGSEAITAVNGKIQLTNIVFGPSSGSHVRCFSGGDVEIYGNYYIAGGALYHFNVSNGSRLSCFGRTITFQANSAFTFFVNAESSALYTFANTYVTGSNTITGIRFRDVLNASIFVNGAAMTYFPGTSASGTFGSGGQYV